VFALKILALQRYISKSIMAMLATDLLIIFSNELERNAKVE
jgi:hypothetical protein